MSDPNDMMTLKTQVQPTQNAGPSSGANAAAQPPRDGDLPLLGLFAVGFALLGIFTIGPVFVPLGLVLGIIALFIGQIGLGLLALFLAVIGIITSPTILTIIGAGALFAWLGL